MKKEQLNAFLQVYERPSKGSLVGVGDFRVGMDLGWVITPVKWISHQVHLTRVRLKDQLSDLLIVWLRFFLQFSLCLEDKFLALSERGWSLVLVSVSDVYGQSLIVERIAIEFEELDEQLTIADRICVYLLVTAPRVPILGFLRK